MLYDPSSEFRFTEFDYYLFGEGTHYDIYKKLGAHLCSENGQNGTLFSVWAPGAKKVTVTCDNNYWDTESCPMQPTPYGVWELFIPDVYPGCKYKFAVTGADGIMRQKADPYAFSSELRPNTASVVTAPAGHEWGDSEYMAKMNEDTLNKPVAIYEVHLGSWKKDYRLNEDGFLNYRTLADQLTEYVKYMGFTHVELIGISEHPLDASWGYQVTGFYSPTCRYGSPDDFRYLVDTLHKNNIGVILDWVPAHFPKDSFGLENFDGTPLYEYGDSLRAEYPEWGTKAFDHGKHQVQCFLISNAMYWINEFHIDALRVDAVASMLYNSFARSEWRPNIYGGTDNLEGIEFLRKLNRVIKENTHALMFAEDSSIMEGITSETKGVALGFTYKWNLGWMHDTLEYIGKDPIYRYWHHYQITHSADYIFDENYVLVLSHDEVVHLKHSMAEKSPGNFMDKLGVLKTLYTYMMTFPGKKLLFMGQEFGQNREWSEDREIDWYLTDVDNHRDVMISLRSLLSIYNSHPVLYSDSGNPVTFEWVNNHDTYRSTFSYIRRNPWNYNSALLVILNFAPAFYNNYSCGVPVDGYYKRIFSTYDFIEHTDEEATVPVTSTKESCDGYDYRITYNIRPYESVIFEFPIIPDDAKGKKGPKSKKSGGSKKGDGKHADKEKKAVKSKKDTKEKKSTK